MTGKRFEDVLREAFEAGAASTEEGLNGEVYKGAYPDDEPPTRQLTWDEWIDQNFTAWREKQIP